MKKLLIVVSLTSLVACSGGGSPSVPGSSTPGSSNDDVGCTQEYYQTMMGVYSGRIELVGSGPTPRMCEWDATIEISGQSVLARCLLRATTTAPTTQLTFFPDEFLTRYQCLDDGGERTVTEPIGPSFSSTMLPGLDNSNYPVEIIFSSNNLIDTGPYFGDESIQSRYVNLIDGSQSNIAEQFTIEGDGTISSRDTNGVLLGTLVKEQ